MAVVGLYGCHRLGPSSKVSRKRTGRSVAPGATGGMCVTQPLSAISTAASTSRRAPNPILENAFAGAAPRSFLAANQQQLIDILRVHDSFVQLELAAEAQPERHDHAVIPPHRPLALVREPPHRQIGP